VAPPEAGPLGEPGKKERDAKRVQAVIDFVQRKSPVTAETTPEQFERCATSAAKALRALGKVKVPALDVEASEQGAAPVRCRCWPRWGKPAGMTRRRRSWNRWMRLWAVPREGGADPGIRPEAGPALSRCALVEFAKEYNEDFKNVILKPDQRGKESAACTRGWP